MHSEQYIRVDYTRAEIMTDAAVHAVGFAAAVIAVPTLVILSAFWFRDMTVVAASAIYGLSVLAMFVCSAIYNIFSPPEWKDTFRRLDQSAIYLKIAGSYTPFAVLAGSGSVLLLTFVWLTAALGAGLIVFSPRRMRRLSLALYLVLGWAGALVGGPMLQALSPTGVDLIMLAGIVYTAGLCFFLWDRLPFHNTIWHVFVVAGTCILYSAVFVEISGHAPVV